MIRKPGKDSRILVKEVKSAWQFFVTFMGWLSDPLNG